MCNSRAGAFQSLFTVRMVGEMVPSSKVHMDRGMVQLRRLCATVGLVPFKAHSLYVWWVNWENIPTGCYSFQKVKNQKCNIPKSQKSKSAIYQKKITKYFEEAKQILKKFPLRSDQEFLRQK